VLVSAANASDGFDLRCELREKLIVFLRAEFPDALPRTRGELTLHGAAADGFANRLAGDSETRSPRIAAGRR
jgi:hypothetical protein